MSDQDARPAQQQRFALALEYDGAAFAGWQKQTSPALETIQSALEAALSSVADQPISTRCAGRTDAGVHATCQVVHFDSPVDRGSKAWTRGVNSLLPATVRVLWATAVDDSFHARHSALSRSYQYLIHPRRPASALLAGRVTPEYGELDIAAMNAAARMLLGEQDFSVFRAAGCQSRSPWREVRRAAVTQQGPLIVFEVQANAFLQHMVRNMVGALLAIGRGEQPPEWMQALLASRDRRQGGITAPSSGLYLTGVEYPAHFGLPATVMPVPILPQPA